MAKAAAGKAATYSDQEVAAALARLALNGGNVKRTAEELCMPRPTLISWRDATNTAVAAQDAAANTAKVTTADTRTDTLTPPADTADTAGMLYDGPPAAQAAPPNEPRLLALVRYLEKNPPPPRQLHQPRDFGALWAESQELAITAALEIAGRVLEDTGPERQAANLRAISQLAHVAAEHHQDYTLGRKGATVNIDQRNQTVNLHADTLIAALLRQPATSAASAAAATSEDALPAAVPVPVPVPPAPAVLDGEIVEP